jgi:solute carrier family 35 protein E3
MSGEQSSRGVRTPSVSSSSAETATHEENGKLARSDQHEDGFEKLVRPEDMEMGDEREDDDLLPQVSEKTEPPKSTFTSSAIWMVVNTLATIGIVSRPYLQPTISPYS